jgi:xanthine dehydrogenase accessory factor
MKITTGATYHTRILAAARDWAGQQLALATVVETWRSAPCPIGTHMLIHEDGRFIGSVSGGCIEGDVLQAAAKAIAGGPHRITRYGVADGTAWDFGLPCGGDITVLVQPVSDSGFAMSLFERIDTAHATGASLLVTTNLDVGVSEVVAVPAPNQFNNLYAPQRRLLIIGAVEIAASLAGIATTLGFGVTVIDPRSRFLTEDRFPGVVRDDRWPDEAVTALRPDSRTAIVTLSHDPKIDDPALVAALAAPTGYVAALGSRKSHEARLERLRAAGIDGAQLTRIEGPAGVTINAISAQEIALSIAAGMIRTLNNGLR